MTGVSTSVANRFDESTVAEVTCAEPEARTAAQRQEITALVDRAQSDVRIRCTMYLDVIGLYNARSRAVHEGTEGADLEAVGKALYFVARERRFPANL